MLAGFVALVIVAVVVVFGGIGFALYKALPAGRSRAALPGRADVLLERTIGELRAGDVVSIAGTDYVCEGAIQYEDSGHRWTCGRIADTHDKHWLLSGLEREGEGTVRLLQPEPSLKFTSYPPEVITVGADSFRLDKRGSATCSWTGDVGFLARAAGAMPGAVERCRWWLYSQEVAPAPRSTTQTQTQDSAQAQVLSQPFGSQAQGSVPMEGQAAMQLQGHGQLAPAERASGSFGLRPPMLLIEQWGSDYRVLRGQAVSLREIQFMPGS